MWDAKPGDKIVCIKGFKPSPLIKQIPQKGCIYTLREVGTAFGGGIGEFVPACRLMEIVNPPQICLSGPRETSLTEIWWTLEYFRPVNKNYSIFEELLKHPLPLRTSRIKETV